MIAHLSGRLLETADGQAIIDVGGVGYLVYCSSPTLDQLANGSESVSIHVDTHVREDHIHLYGFAETSERDWFRLLISVQGVGARMAIGILSALRPDELTSAIVSQDKTALKRASGVGPKLAVRILTELKDKVVGMDWSGIAAPVSGDIMPAAPAGATAEAVSALVNLGYGRSEAMRAISTASGSVGSSADSAVLIRAGLKALAQ